MNASQVEHLFGIPITWQKTLRKASVWWNDFATCSASHAYLPAPDSPEAVFEILHERGHLSVESKYPNCTFERGSGRYTATTYRNEVAAWRWAIRYCRRNSIPLDRACWELVEWSLDSYNVGNARSCRMWTLLRNEAARRLRDEDYAA